MDHDGFLRSGELLSGFKVSDLMWSSDHSQFTVVLNRSTLNRSGDGESVTICDYEGRSAVKLMIQWCGIMERWDSPWLWDRTLSTDWLRDIIKRTVVDVGLDLAKFSTGRGSHYFLIKRMGRWESDAATLYNRCEESDGCGGGCLWQSFSPIR
jgi:hypothetical protein